MRILVTGGAGFIGSHVAETYLRAGHDVCVVDDLSSGFRRNVPRSVRLHEVDIRDTAALLQVFEDEKPEVVSHQAARANVRESLEKPELYASVNVVGSVSVLECCRKSGVRKIIYASTGGAVYGEPSWLPVSEDHPIKPLDPYGASKHHVEHYLYVYQVNYNLAFTALRYPNVYGPRQDPGGEAGVVAIFTGLMIQGKQPVINGSGEQERDFVHVGDVARANLLALERADNEIVNIGSGVGTDINTIYALLAQLTGFGGEPFHGPVKKGEVQRIFLNARRARDLLGWTAEIPLREGLASTVEIFEAACGARARGDHRALAAGRGVPAPAQAAPNDMQTMIPGLVSVMMPAYNAARFIRQAIASLLAQSYADWELIVVNDGSTDGTEELARAFGDRRIHVVDQANGGEAAARNTALEHMRGEYTAFLDADDAYQPRHLELAVGHLQANSKRDGVYSDGYYVSESGARLQRLSSRRLPPSEGRIFDQVVATSSMLGPPVCVVLHRGVIQRHLLSFDTGIGYGPDWDFFTRFAEVACFGYVGEPTCLYRVHGGNKTVLCAGRRTADLAKSRIKAIRLSGFAGCSLQTRIAVFYDLLVNLLRGNPQQQTAITGSDQFQALPAAEQARLFRLMASKTVIYEPRLPQVSEWFRMSRALNPSDPQAAILYRLYAMSPALCRCLLRIRTARQTDPLRTAPFADLKAS